MVTPAELQADPCPSAPSHAGAITRFAASALLMVGLQLRPTTTSTGSVFPQLQTGTAMSPILASMLVATPVMCFAFGSALAWPLRRLWGSAATVTGALVALTAALLARPMGGALLLWLCTVVACLAIAVLSTLLPPLVKGAPTDQQGRLNALWTSGLGAGSALGALATALVLAPLLGWRLALGSWGLLAGAALVSWLLAARQFTDPTRPRRSLHLGPLSLRPRLPVFALTIHFGLLTGASFALMGWLADILAEHARVRAGHHVAWMFGIAMSIGVLIAPRVAKAAARIRDQRLLVLAVGSPTFVGTLGLLLAPNAGPWAPWVWSAAIGIGMPSVVLALTLIHVRTRDGQSAAALSSMVQSVGYGIAWVVSFGVGLLHAATDSWHLPLAALVLILAGQAVAGAFAGFPTTVAVRHVRTPLTKPVPTGGVQHA